MTRFETEIRTLATSRLSGQRFEGFIRRWEMNKEPKPVSLPKPDVQSRRPSLPRELEAAEEDYFHADDEEQTPIVRIVDSTLPIGNALKRKRGRSMGSGTGFMPGRAARPSNVPARPSPALPSLVDYADEDDDAASPSDAESTPSPHPSPSPSPAPESKQVSPVHSTAALPTAKVTNGAPASGETEDDVHTDTEPRLPPMKRRRDDEDDESLERLAKSKRPSLDGQGPRPSSPASPEKGPKPGTAASVIAKQKEEGTPGGGPKKIKLKFGTAALGVAASAPATTEVTPTSEPDSKDADTG